MPEYTGKLADPDFRRARAAKAAQTRTTPAYHLTRVRELVEASRAAQGLPPTIVDDLTLDQIAALIEEDGPDAPAA